MTVHISHCSTVLSISYVRSIHRSVLRHIHLRFSLLSPQGPEQNPENSSFTPQLLTFWFAFLSHHTRATLFLPVSQNWRSLGRDGKGDCGWRMSIMEKNVFQVLPYTPVFCSISHASHFGNNGKEEQTQIMIIVRIRGWDKVQGGYLW